MHPAKPLLLAVVLALAACNSPRGAGPASSIIKGAEAEDADYAVFP